MRLLLMDGLRPAQSFGSKTRGGKFYQLWSTLPLGNSSKYSSKPMSAALWQRHSLVTNGCKWESKWFAIWLCSNNSSVWREGCPLGSTQNPCNKIQPTITIMTATNNYVCYWLIYRSLLVNLLYNSPTANLLSKHFVQSLGEKLPQWNKE